MELSQIFLGFWQFVIVVLLLLCGGFLLSTRVARFRHFFFRLINITLIPPVLLASLITRVEGLFRKPRWHVGGRCKKCGRCCKLLAMSLPLWAAKRPFPRQIVCWYFQENYGMVPAGCPEKGWLLFSCPNLDANRLCAIYKRRPRICREYPLPSNFSDIPPDCGFKIEPACNPRKHAD